MKRANQFYNSDTFLIIKGKVKKMKMITCMIKPFKLDEIRAGLAEVNIKGMTITEVKGFGRQKGQQQYYQASAMTVDFLPKVRIEIAVDNDKNVQRVVDKILEIAHTNKAGDGKIFITNIEEVIRISDKSRGEQAI